MAENEKKDGTVKLKARASVLGTTPVEPRPGKAPQSRITVEASVVDPKDRPEGESEKK